MVDVKGVLVSAITPRGKDGEIDLGAAFEMVDFLCAARVNGIVLFGAAGEYPAATFEERNRLIYLAAKRSRAPVYAAVGSANLERSLALARGAHEGGAAGTLVPPPFFFRYRQDEIREFYRAFAAGAGGLGSAFLYHIPAHASGIEPQTAIELLKSGGFAGIADAGGGRGMIERLCASDGLAGEYPILAARDAEMARARWAGAPACLSDAACAVPELVAALDRAITAGDQAEAARLDGLLQEFLSWADRLPPLMAIKTAMELRGLKAGAAPSPLPRERQGEMEAFRGWFMAALPGFKPESRKRAAGGRA